MTSTATAVISPQCAGHIHIACKTPTTCACPGCHNGDCTECGKTNLQKTYEGPTGQICGTCNAARADRRAGAYTPCDNDATHGRGFRNPKTRRNEFFCMQCHAASGDPLPLRRSDVATLAACVTEDISSEAHVWVWIRGNKFACLCGATKFDAALRKQVRG